VTAVPRRLLAGVVACFFLSGATGLVYEVLWIRMLGLVFGHTVFAVTTVLTAFMAGLGLGSCLRTHRRPSGAPATALRPARDRRGRLLQWRTT
jgi:predicted membrane-bound spermidine synthase